MPSKQVMLDKELTDGLDMFRTLMKSSDGTKASYSDVIKALLNSKQDIPTVSRKHLKEIQDVLLLYYKGDKGRASVTTLLYTLILEYIKSDIAGKYIQEELVKIIENAATLNNKGVKDK